ncbi:MAG: RagB/SusD family nutrient uptake outer membrane protein [Chitinophagaceae bacterium]|nr:RagB/SusD family nutrient uptake outer membrane protein [Chitinophagaceae bacterium]MCW5928293.1 RagB/SusD family nutrient uptake outer membrane protein [Chitinophagaceae bacterium]
MKTIKYNKFVFLFMIASIACNKDKWLKEVPLDFYSTENVYKTPEQFNYAITDIYSKIPAVTYLTNDFTAPVVGGFADNLYHFYGPTAFGHHNRIIPEGGTTSYFWDRYYKIISSSNVILDRIDEPDVVFNTETLKNQYKAEAMFFRAYAYKCLAILYGGVPVILDEIKEPKRDFVRAGKEAVLSQAISDLEYAVNNLPEVTDLVQDGRLTRAAAYHLLTEVYLTVDNWDKAIEAATKVISNPNYTLMTERFGRRADKPGDAFRDLFIRNNQNRMTAGNTEGIWVGQYEHLVMGTAASPQGTRFYGVWYWQLRDKNNVPLFLDHSSQNGGRGIGFYANNDFINDTIWQGDLWDDMRNSEYNIQRDMIADNPNSDWYGKKIIEEDAILDRGLYHEYWRPIWTKLIPMDDFPDDVIADLATGRTLTTAHSSFTDTYLMRLSETYLFRAEAYFRKGDHGAAAADINVIRGRAKAKLVTPDQITLDFILDERLRELNLEELRLMTLMRTGTLLDRARKHNPNYNGQFASHPLDNYKTLFPIPQSEIERNTGAKLEQNPGYPGGR